MTRFQTVLFRGFARLESGCEATVGAEWNPFGQLGALGFFCFYVAAGSGLYLFGFHPILWDFAPAMALGADEPSIHGVVLALHLRSVDALLAVMVIHGVREIAFDRLGGPRRLAWSTGVFMLAVAYASGVAGSFLAGETADRSGGWDAALLILHLALPLLVLGALWLHLQRISHPRCRLPWRLVGVALGALVAAAVIWPAAPPARSTTWAFLPGIELARAGPFALAAAAVVVALAIALPWQIRRPQPAAARVDLAWCNGCGRCVDDCPYVAISLKRRSDHRPFSEEAVVDPARCVGCGLCVAACPTAVAFNADADLPTAIDLPDLSLRSLREEMRRAPSRAGPVEPRILVFGCRQGGDARSLTGHGVVGISLPCLGMLPPTFIDYALSRKLADGVLLAGCPGGLCRNRFGMLWTAERLAGVHDPVLRPRVPRERVQLCAIASDDRRRFDPALAEFRQRLAALPSESGGSAADEPAEAV